MGREDCLPCGICPVCQGQISIDRKSNKKKYNKKQKRIRFKQNKKRSKNPYNRGY